VPVRCSYVRFNFLVPAALLVSILKSSRPTTCKRNRPSQLASPGQPIRPSVRRSDFRRPRDQPTTDSHGDTVASPSRQAPAASRRPGRGRLDCHSAKAVVDTGKRRYAAASVRPVRRSTLLQVSLHPAIPLMALWQFAYFSPAHGTLSDWCGDAREPRLPEPVRFTAPVPVFVVPVVPGEWRLSASELPQITHYKGQHLHSLSEHLLFCLVRCSCH
jgi:hypothetical protein